ncbi:M24 family metallopeptidase [Enterococcus sp. HY326]|uniref:M24 family metallopeptidase n=1 Tax=Enterococcus sp. HY326 TaxID=2971265 RepID=UPI00223EA25A|nr:M24 family metallopeptidase [Enterococcus sp. HY326]
MRLINKEDIELKSLAEPQQSFPIAPIQLTDETMVERKMKILNLMSEVNLDCLVIYGDLEHGSNFEYLTGFLTRFEEGMLVLHRDGNAYLLLGNENLNKADKARLIAKSIHVPHFSLPNQPMDGEEPFETYLQRAGIKKNQKVGLVGWKMFTTKQVDARKIYDTPYYIVQALIHLVGEEKLENYADFFIGGAKGARTTNNANELAHYEFGAQLASFGLLKALNQIEVGMSEMTLGNLLNQAGQRNSVVTIAAAGERFIKANIYPTEKKLKQGETLSLTVGYKGGLSSRAGYVARGEEDLPSDQKDYLEKVAKPYFAAVVSWLENMKINSIGADIYNLIDKVLPQKKYHWHLNPGHLVADEEWMSSPIYPDSSEVLKSGMLLQIDIIPSVSGYAGASCESTIALADEELRNDLHKKYPLLWGNIVKRRSFLKDILNIQLPPEVLPMSDTVAYYRPFMLDKQAVLRKKQSR